MCVWPCAAAVPHPQAVIAVLQLVNRMEKDTFDRCDDLLLRGVASQASVLLATAKSQVQRRAVCCFGCNAG